MALALGLPVPLALALPVPLALALPVPLALALPVLLPLPLPLPDKIPLLRMSVGKLAAAEVKVVVEVADRLLVSDAVLENVARADEDRGGEEETESVAVRVEEPAPVKEAETVGVCVRELVLVWAELAVAEEVAVDGAECLLELDAAPEEEPVLEREAAPVGICVRELVEVCAEEPVLVVDDKEVVTGETALVCVAEAGAEEDDDVGLTAVEVGVRVISCVLDELVLPEAALECVCVPVGLIVAVLERLEGGRVIVDDREELAMGLLERVLERVPDGVEECDAAVELLREGRADSVMDIDELDVPLLERAFVPDRDGDTDELEELLLDPEPVPDADEDGEVLEELDAVLLELEEPEDDALLDVVSAAVGVAVGDTVADADELELEEDVPVELFVLSAVRVPEVEAVLLRDDVEERVGLTVPLAVALLERDWVALPV